MNFHPFHFYPLLFFKLDNLSFNGTLSHQVPFKEEKKSEGTGD